LPPPVERQQAQPAYGAPVPRHSGTNADRYIPFPGFSHNRDYVSSDGSKLLPAVQVGYERRFSAGLIWVANYTRSKCMMDRGPCFHDRTAVVHVQDSSRLRAI